MVDGTAGMEKSFPVRPSVNPITKLPVVWLDHLGPKGWSYEFSALSPAVIRGYAPGKATVAHCLMQEIQTLDTGFH